MKLSDVSNLDVRMCVQLLNLLKAGRWELSGPDIAAHADTVRWVQSVATQIGESVKGSAPKVPDTTPGFTVKNMGPIAGPKPRKKK